MRSLKEIIKDADEEYAAHGLSKRYEKLAQEIYSHPKFIETRRREIKELSKVVPGEMDPGIVDVVEALNASGYTTIGSCIGHGGKRGYINFIDFPEGETPVKEVKDILRSYGFKDLVFKRSPNKGWWTGLNAATITFKGMD
jgi:hypothetical protein